MYKKKHESININILQLTIFNATVIENESTPSDLGIQQPYVISSQWSGEKCKLSSTGGIEN